MATLETTKVRLLQGRFPWAPEATWVQIKEYAPTFLTEFTVMGSQIVVYKLAAHFLGRQGFSEYAVARRAVSTIYPLALLGLGVALPRYIASCVGPEEGKRPDHFFAATVWCVGGAVAILIAAINLMPSLFGYLVFGGATFRGLALPISLIITGLALHAIVYSYLRGRLLMSKANGLQLVNLAIIPLLSFWQGSHHSVNTVLTKIGLYSIGVSLLGLSFTPWRKLASNCAAEARVLLRYGVPRIAGDFAQMALLGLPTFVVAHRVGVEQAGYVAFGVSMLSMIGAVFTPVGLILLPKSSQMIAEGAGQKLRIHVLKVIKITFVIASGLTVLAWFTADPLVRLYLGTDYSGVARFLRLICLGAIPYSLFLVARNLLDAFHEQAVTSAFLIISLCVFGLAALTIHGKGGGADLILGSLLASITVLGLLTLMETLRILRRLRPA